MVKMKTFKSLIAKTGMMILLVMLLSSCGTGSTPEGVVNDFFTYAKEGNIKKMVECYEPSVQEQLKSVLSVLGSNVDINSLGNLLPDYLKQEKGPNVKYKITGTSQNDASHATVEVDLINDGTKLLTVPLKCVKIDGKWYISNTGSSQ